MPQVTIQYFDGCPNWKTMSACLSTLVDEGLDVDVGYELIDSHEAAVARGFRGSPTVLIDGVDPFADKDAPVGLACRIYRTENGTVGSPSLSQIREAITTAGEELHNMVTGIDRDKLRRLIEDEDAQIVDVLPESEYTEAHIPGAVNIPLKQLTAETVAFLSPGQPVVVYCHDGL